MPGIPPDTTSMNADCEAVALFSESVWVTGEIQIWVLAFASMIDLNETSQVRWSELSLCRRDRFQSARMS